MGAMNGAAPTVETLLAKQQFLSLTTYKRSGQAVPTPVWFALDAGKIYVMTMVVAGKAKRIRNNGKVDFAPCTMRGEVTGPSLPGNARLIPAAEGGQPIERLLTKKYGLMKRMFDLFQRKERVYIEITPA